MSDVELSAEKDAATMCDAEGWTHNGEEVVCELPPGHGGPHVDRWMGWEWPSPRVIPPEGGE